MAVSFIVWLGGGGFSTQDMNPTDSGWNKAKPLPRSEADNGEKCDNKTAQSGTIESEAAEDVSNWICAEPNMQSGTNEASHLTRTR